MRTLFCADYNNYTAESMELVKHHLRHEWFYQRIGEKAEMTRRNIMNRPRIYTKKFVNGEWKNVSYCEAFEHKDGMLHFTKTKRLN